MRILAADVGGTHTRLALFESTGRGLLRQPRQERTVESAGFSGLLPLVVDFLAEVPERPDAACFAVAGPVVEGVARLPNLGWEVRRHALERETGLEHVLLINDFDAVGHALAVLEPADFEELQPGVPEEGGSLAVIGPGTGLGHAFLVRADRRFQVHGSEGGHADFAPRGALQCRLLRFLTERYGRTSWERVLSGPGLVDLYRFLRDREGMEEREETRLRREREDPARVISELGLAGEDPLCVQALELFAAVLGAQAGNFALSVQATGGVYVAGGIAPKILPALRRGAFLDAFRDKGRMAELMERMPVRVILEPHAGLLGAAARALEAFRDLKP